MKDLGITEGEWEKLEINITDYKQLAIICGKKVIAHVYLPDYEIKEEHLANAKLIADAGTTANKCGLLPSELLEQRDEMLEMLQDILDTIRECETPRLYEIEQLIKKITKP